jgi:hypothetical protein
MSKYNDPKANECQINAPVTRELFEQFEDARYALRVTRAEFARRAFAAYLAQVPRKAA